MINAPVVRLSGFYGLYFGVIAIMIAWQAPYFASLGFSATDIGLLLGMAGSLKVVSPLIWGWIGDHISQRIWIIRAGAVLCSLIALFLPNVTEFWGLAIVLCAFSFFWDAILSQFDAVTFEHLGEHGRVWYPRVRGVGSAGFVVLAIGSGYWFEVNPIEHWPYWMLGLAGIMAAVTFAVPGRRVEAGEIPTTQGFVQRVMTPAVLAFVISAFLIKLSTAPLNVFFTLFAIESGGHSQLVAGWLWAIGVIVEVIILVGLSQYLAKFDPRTLMLTALLVTLVRWPLIAFGIESLPLMVFAASLHGITFGVFHAGAMEFLRQSFPRQQLGRGIALYSTLGFGAANMLGSPISGVLYDAGGGQLAFLVATFIALPGVFLMAWQMRAQPQL